MLVLSCTVLERDFKVLLKGRGNSDQRQKTLLLIIDAKNPEVSRFKADERDCTRALLSN
jgi:hypothetical protein